MPEEVRITAIVVAIAAAVLIGVVLFITRRFPKRRLLKIAVFVPIGALLFVLVTAILIAGGTGSEKITEGPCYGFVEGRYVEVPCPTGTPNPIPPWERKSDNLSDSGS